MPNNNLKKRLSNRRLESGYSLVELIIVLALLAILSFVAVTEFNDSSSNLKEKSLAQKILADVRYAQEMAMTHRNEVKFIINPSLNQYSLKWADNSYLKTPIAEKDFIFNISGSEFAGTMITSTDFFGGLLSFDSKGKPKNNGVYLTEETELICLNNSISIIIIPGTGTCYIQE